MKFTYCSFASESGFLGGLVLEGWLSPIQAATTAYALGVHPGGEMVAIHAPEDLPKAIDQWHAERVGRLLSMEEMGTVPGGVVRKGPDFRSANVAGVIPE